MYEMYAHTAITYLPTYMHKSNTFVGFISIFLFSKCSYVKEVHLGIFLMFS